MSFNFALILFWLMVVTGVVWFADRLVFRPGRVRKARVALDRFDREAASRAADPALLADERHRLEERLLRQPGWIEFPAGFFPVILVVFVLRSFLFDTVV